MSLMLNRIGKALKNILYGLEEAAAKRRDYLLKNKEKRYFDTKEFDLGDARDRFEVEIYGDVMFIESIDGTATLFLNEEDSKELTCYTGRKIYQDFYRFFISNTAQAGKTLKLIIGRDGCFDIFDTDYWINLLKDSQDTAKEVLDTIQEGTDKIIDDMASQTKQDAAKGVLDTIDTALDTIYGDMATSVKQDYQATLVKQNEIITEIKKISALFMVTENEATELDIEAGQSDWETEKTWSNSIVVPAGYEYEITAARYVLSIDGTLVSSDGDVRLSIDGNKLCSTNHAGSVYVDYDTTEEPDPPVFLSAGSYDILEEARETGGGSCRFKDRYIWIYMRRYNA